VGRTDVCFLFDDQRAPRGARASLLFEGPARQIRALCGEDVAPALAQVDAERARGRHVCGYIAYEAGAFLTGPRRRALPGGSSTPLVDFYSFDRGVDMTADEVTEWLATRCDGPPAAVHDVTFTETRETYRAKVAAIKSHIRRGDTYQVNFTFKCRFELEGTPLSLYRHLRGRQRVELGAYARVADREILSLSPELFVRKQGDWLTFKPMKGTAARGASPEEDERIVAALRVDPKTVSENVMIVDLMRSDLGRVAQIGSVFVDKLLDVETFETVHQVVSTVCGKVGTGMPLGEVLTQVFPCGSVTGAPKVRTMEILDGLESEPRGLYAGALGRVEPSGDFCFSVPIRTVVLRDGHGEMGVGSGIVHESDADSEWDECSLKASFLTRSNDRLRLIETLRFDGPSRELVHLDAHLARMQSSARYFHFEFDRGTVLDAIRRAVAEPPGGVCKLRVLLTSRGRVEVSVEAIGPIEGAGGARPWVTLSANAIDSTSCFRRHKTTERKLYDEAYEACTAAGGYDVVFLNERGEVAEASRHNVFVEKGGRMLTPPVSAGALPGIARQSTLDDPGLNAAEGILGLEDLRSASRIWLTNSVRGIVQVDLRPELASDRLRGTAVSTCSI
jgi:para-aminobenzoate synthetase/4-amino-4-deoxychorismate lyase